MAFAVHRTAELAFTDAAAGLLAGNNPVAWALVVAALIATLRSRPRARPGDRRHPGIRDGPARM
jgi:zinc/manganese transport system permease protein